MCRTETVYYAGDLLGALVRMQWHSRSAEPGPSPEPSATPPAPSFPTQPSNCATRLAESGAKPATDANGVFEVLALDPASGYNISVTKSGFAVQERTGLDVLVGEVDQPRDDSRNFSRTDQALGEGPAPCR